MALRCVDNDLVAVRHIRLMHSDIRNTNDRGAHITV